MDLINFFVWYKLTPVTSYISLREDDVILEINADGVMHAIKIGGCHSSFLAGCRHACHIDRMMS